MGYLVHRKGTQALMDVWMQELCQSYDSVIFCNGHHYVSCPFQLHFREYVCMYVLKNLQLERGQVIKDFNDEKGKSDLLLILLFLL